MTKSFIASVGIEGLIIGINTIIAYHIGLGISPQAASTMAFATLCLSRLVHGYNSKSEKPVLFKGEMWNNKYLNGSFIIGFILLNAVVLIPVLQPVFRTVSVGMSNMLIVYALAVSNLFEIQLVKLIKSKMSK